MTASAGLRVDWSHLFEQLGDDRAVIDEIVEAYITDTRANVELLPRHLASGNASEVRRHAHILGGTMRTFGVEEACALARELERRAASGELEGASEIVADLLAAARNVLPELERFVDGDAGAVR